MELTQAPSQDSRPFGAVPVKKGRGRPKGSKNKAKKPSPAEARRRTSNLNIDCDGNNSPERPPAPKSRKVACTDGTPFTLFPFQPL